MTAPDSSNRPLGARRLVLLATVAGLGLGTLYGPEVRTYLPGFASPALAQTAPQPIPRTDPRAPIGFADIVEKVKPAVVSVRVRVESPQATGMDFDDRGPFAPGSPMERFFRRFGQPDGSNPDNFRGPGQRGPFGQFGPGQRRFTQGQGSGFFISANGYVVTNNHVIDRSSNVQVTTDDGQTHTAKVVGTDPRTDLALLKIDGRNDFPFVQLADTPPRVGDWVIAVGNPFGLGGTVTAGIVSARGRDIGAGPYDDFIQIDAAVNRGNSGGPTFDTNGNVIGVNTAIFSPTGGSVGIGFAISAETIRNVVAQLEQRGKVTRGWIGVQIQPVTRDIADSLGLKEPGGALVAEVQPDSPASTSNLQAGDVVTSVNGERIENARELSRRIGSMPPGSKVQLGVLRKGGSQDSVTLTLGELPDQREARAGGERGFERDGQTGEPRLGLSLAPADQVSGAKGPGVVVTGVDPNGPAAEAGFRTGDIILEVGGKQVSSPEDVRNALKQARSENRRTVLMRLRSGEQSKFVAVPLQGQRG